MKKQVSGSLHCLILVAAVFLTGLPADAITRPYVGPDGGSWNTPANWNPSGVPVAGDTVFMGSDTPTVVTPNVDVNYNGIYAAGSVLTSLSINSTGINGVFSLDQTASSSVLRAVNETIGVSVTGNVYNQTAGTNTITQLLTLGSQLGGVGVYNMGGGVVNAAGIVVAGAGTGTFNQTGGIVNGGDSTVGSSTGTGIYNLANGTLNLTSLTIGNNGTFNLKTGGILTGIAGVLNMNGGTFNLLGGVFTSAPYLAITGTFRLNGNSLSAVGLDSSGTALVESGSGNGVLTINAATGNGYAYHGTIQNGASGTFALVKSGGGLQRLDGISTYSGSTTLQAGTLQLGSNTGFSPNSAFIVTGGVLDVNGQFASIASLNGNGGTIAISTGTLTVGNAGSSSFGGPVTGSGTLDLASSQVTLAGGGTFNGTINAQGSLNVGAANGIPTGAALNLTNIGSALNVNANQQLASVSGLANTNLNFSNNSQLTIGSGNADTSFVGNFSGTGLLTKTGIGTFTIGNGTFDTNSNTASGLAFGINGGTLALNKADGTNAIGGALTISGGSVSLASGNQIADTAAVTLTGGSFNLNSHNETIGNLSGSGLGNISLAGGTLTVASSAAGIYAGTITGPGSVVKNGVADLTLSGAGNFLGSYTASGGRLILQGAANAASYVANSGATLRFESGPVALNGNAILANSGGTVEYNDATVNNGFLRGAGTHTIVGGTNVFNAITTFNSTNLVQSASTTFNNFTNGGKLTNNFTATINGGTNTSSGVITVNGTLNTTDLTSNGVISINNGGSISNTGSTLVLGGGSRTTINPGGSLTTTAGNVTTLEVNGALLVNNGSISGRTNVNYGGLAKGTGVFGIVNVTTGGVFSPGNSPGYTTANGFVMGEGGTFLFEVGNVTGAPGVGYDYVNNLLDLSIGAGTTPQARFILSLATLNSSNAPGLADNFDPSLNHDFTIIHSAGGITGFDPTKFVIDSSTFLNPTNGGIFTVVADANDLNVRFLAVPEAGPTTMIGVSAILLFLSFRKRTESRNRSSFGR